MKATWKDIPGYGGKYQVDREGNVRRVYRPGKTRSLTPQHKKMCGSQRLVVRLTVDGKAEDRVLMQLVARTFLGPAPDGCVAHHKNGCQSDNYVNNIEYVTKEELGKINGAKSRRKPVAKLGRDGEIVQIYSSAREAARENYMSYQTIIDRCNGRCRSAFAPDGFAYAWDDDKRSMDRAIKKIRMLDKRMGERDA